MGFRRVAKVDINQKEIVEALRKKGAFVLHLHQLKNAFDILVAYEKRLYCLEIKNGNAKLTEGEIKCKEQMEARGVPYYVVRNVGEALDIVTNNTK